MNTALIIVDVQNDFLSHGSLPVPDGEAVIPIINRLQKEFSIVLASMDYHPHDHGSFAIHYPGKQPGDRVMLHGVEQILWPVHAVQGSPGASFAAGLDICRIQQVIRKGMDRKVDSYSAFFDNNKVNHTGLSNILHSLFVDTLYVTGLAADYCALFTALDAVKEGFRTYFYTNASRAVNLQPTDYADSLKKMEQAGVTLL